MEKEMPKTEEEWKKTLTPEQYSVMREKATEAPFTGKLLHEMERYVYMYGLRKCSFSFEY